MADTSKIPETIRRAAGPAGLGRALELFPETVKAAWDRGTRPLGAPPEGTPPLLHPAPVFDPTQFERDK
jgi:hypothetical protein